MVVHGAGSSECNHTSHIPTDHLQIMQVWLMELRRMRPGSRTENKTLEGSVESAIFLLNGQKFQFGQSSLKHSVSTFVACITVSGLYRETQNCCCSRRKNKPERVHGVLMVASMKKVMCGVPPATLHRQQFEEQKEGIMRHCQLEGLSILTSRFWFQCGIGSGAKYIQSASK